jgi:hypothetical protein
MRQSNNSVIAFLLITFFAILASLTSCGLIEPESLQENLTTASQGAYTFNPDEVLTDISMGKGDIFTILVSTPAPPLRNSEYSVDWNQADFFKIAEAFNKQVWKESLQDWNINLMFFSGSLGK